MARLALVLLIGLLLGGCGDGVPDPTKAETTYGVSVDATDAHPAPAVAAEARLYADHFVTVEGRVTAVTENGCHYRIDTGSHSPLLVRAARTDDGSCAWQLPPETNGVAVAAGTLRAAGDTLRLTANGVRVTPVRLSSPDS
jgi:PBP1b-binding outer membrane lipoprotein LpoB